MIGRPRRLGRAQPQATLDPWREKLATIAELGTDLRSKTDDSLRRQAARLRERARAGTPPETLTPETFALVGEIARRTLGLDSYQVQIAGGLAMLHRAVVEMATGEGKTLAAVSPVAVRALGGRGAHVLTFNDYLARRDAAWMAPIYEFLGLSVAAVGEGMTAAQRRQAYACDVTYLTAREAGFDFLRDSLCLDVSQRVQRPFHFALVDEADSILIDEARIPLVIAGSTEEDRIALGRLADLARQLEHDADFDTDAYGRTIFLTAQGSHRVEGALGCGSLFDSANAGLLADLRNALHAEYLLRRDVDYIVRNGVVELVDEFTGRVAQQRKWPDGLHGAVEAKEGLRLGDDGQLLGSITLQHLVQRYPQLAGMTATAVSAAEELRHVYDLDVVVIPSNVPSIRCDEADLVFTDRAARDEALRTEIVEAHGAGRPVLVGTVSVAESERLAASLQRAGIACRVLNAKNDAEEAEIVAEAGRLEAVTISTNMAGRGTDIRLGGRDETDRERVVELGGLYVIGTNRHESRRIDRQLRGRAGRQGDPGSSRFFISLEDDLLVRHGIQGLVPKKAFPERSTLPIASRLVRREVDRAQRIAEGQAFDARKRLYDYARIIEEQRRYVDDWRRAILDGQAVTLFAQRHAAKRAELEANVGSEDVRAAERRVMLTAIDRQWSRYVTDMQATRDEMPLVALDGRVPLAEFYRSAIDSFRTLLEHVDETASALFEGLQVVDGRVDWNDAELRGPSATWTYLVHDNIYTTNVLLGLSTRASIGLIATLALGPVLFLWGLYLHWQKWRDRQADG